MNKQNETKPAVTLNGNAIMGVGIVAATRKGTGKDEALGYVLALRTGTVKQNGDMKYSFAPLAELVRGSTALEEALDKYTAKTQATRRAALALAADFSDKYHVPMLAMESAEWARVKDEAEEAKPAKATKSASERATAALGKMTDSERWAYLSAAMADMLGKVGTADATAWLTEQTEALTKRAATAAAVVESAKEQRKGAK